MSTSHRTEARDLVIVDDNRGSTSTWVKPLLISVYQERRWCLHKFPLRGIERGQRISAVSSLQVAGTAGGSRRNGSGRFKRRHFALLTVVGGWRSARLIATNFDFTGAFPAIGGWRATLSSRVTRLRISTPSLRKWWSMCNWSFQSWFRVWRWRWGARLRRTLTGREYCP